MILNFDGLVRRQPSKNHGCWKIFLFGFIICILILDDVLCDGDGNDKTTTPKEEPNKQNKLIKIIKKNKTDKPIIIEAERVENPPNWNSWTPVAQNSTNWMQIPMTTPLSLEEQDKRIKYHQLQQKRREEYEKLNRRKNVNKGKVTLESLKRQMMHFGKILMSSIAATSLGPFGEFGRLASNFVSNSMGSGGGGGEYGGAQTRQSGNGYSEKNSYQESRSALGWLSRLIGIQGKTLGEFLREYQVHVLYDLVFIFFKWIFFVYAGLLIP